jgi:hypothetical protein
MSGMKLHGVVVLLISAVCFGAVNVPDAAKMVPDNTLLLVNVPSFSSLESQWKKTSYYKFYADPAMAGFVASLKSKWQARISKENDEFGRFWQDVNSLPSGRLAIAMVAPQDTTKSTEPQVLLISQWGPAMAKVKAAIEKSAKKSVDEGAQRTKEAFRGYDIITIKKKEAGVKEVEIKRTGSGSSSSMGTTRENFASDSDNESDNYNSDNSADENTPAQPEKPKETSISYCFADDLLLASEDAETLKFALSHITGSTGKTLAETPDYTATMGIVGPVHDLDIYLNIRAMIDMATAEDKSGQTRVQLGNFGVDNVSSLAFSAAVGRTDGNPIAVKGIVKVNGAKRGILKMIEPISDTVQVPRFVEPSAVSVSMMNFSLSNIYDEIFKIASSINPGIGAMLGAPIIPAGPDGQGGVELKKDILSYIGPRIILAESLKKPFTPGIDPTRYIFGFAVTDSKALERSLSQVHARFITTPNSRRDFMGHTIYLLGAVPGLPGMGLGQMAAGIAKPKSPLHEESKLAFTVTDSYVILGSEAEVEQALRNLSNKDSTQVSTLAWFNRAKTPVPAKVGVAAFADDRSSLECLWWIVKDQLKTSSPSHQVGPGAMFFNSLHDIADFNLLPDYDKVKKYFGVSSSYMVSKPEGFYFEWFLLDLK